ncbi:MAG: response regulator [Thermoanaerobaculales bacterium]|nr:response regulator [Thermoanaerobaculales bacterium]
MSRTILLADDSLTIQKVVELTFADTEYEVVAVSSGDDLLQRLPEVRPDLVICDVIMPGRDGYDVCQEIKSNSDFLHLPVILLTGTFEPFDRDRAIAVGCSEIITKPFEAKKLVDAVERLAATPAAPPPAAVDTQSIGPEDFSAPDADDELDDTKVSQEFGPGELVAEDAPAVDPVEEIAAETPLAEQAVEPPQDQFELGDEIGGLELDSTDLPDVEAPLEIDEPAESIPDPAKTLAVEDFAAIMETEEVGTVSDVAEPALTEEPFIDAGAEDEVFPSEEEDVESEPPEEVKADNSLTTPIDVAAVMADHQPEVVPAMAHEVDEPPNDAKDDADTQDFGDKPPAQEVSEETGGIGLSDDDVDRIARRLLELASDRIEHIAWDVIPDMAEVVVRERMREIEANAEGEPS